MRTPIAPIEPRANPDLLGQDRAIAVLRDAWRSGRPPHAWLISGPRGIGKATLAFRLARALLADADATDADLGLPPEHPVFRQVAAGAHPDLRVLEPPREARSNRQRSEIAVEVVRNATAAMHSTAAMGGHRVVIVDGAELLNRNAANALLKPLEEPPPATTLILVSHHPGRVMPTLRSRCAKLRLGRPDDEAVEAILGRQPGRRARARGERRGRALPPPGERARRRTCRPPRAAGAVDRPRAPRRRRGAPCRHGPAPGAPGPRPRGRSGPAR